MSEDKSVIKRLLNKIKSSKKIQNAIIIFAVLVIVFGLLFFNFSSKKEETIVSETDYVNSLENKLSAALSKVEGAGKVSVVITVESGMETVLAMKTTVTETASGKETVETPILVNGKTVVLKEMYPKITGVLIISEGAKSISVMNKIQQATVSLFDINPNQIEILSMK